MIQLSWNRETALVSSKAGQEINCTDSRNWCSWFKFNNKLAAVFWMQCWDAYKLLLNRTCVWTARKRFNGRWYPEECFSLVFFSLLQLPSWTHVGGVLYLSYWLGDKRKLIPLCLSVYVIETHRQYCFGLKVIYHPCKAKVSDHKGQIELMTFLQFPVVCKPRFSLLH